MPLRYAFYQSGIVFGTILIIFLSFVAYITVLWSVLLLSLSVTLSDSLTLLSGLVGLQRQAIGIFN
jgi:hypothetical protein